MWKPLASIIAALALAGCVTTVPVVAIGDNGFVLRGTATATQSGGSFMLSGSGTSCGGTYNAQDTSITISLVIFCNDGRKGIGIVTRDSSGLSGSGRVRMEDGAALDFIFGQTAAQF